MPSGSRSGCSSGPAVLRVAVLADTHAPRFWKSMPPAVAEHLDDVDVILHAGDVCTPDVLEELTAYAPVHVVLGNNDGPDVAAWGAPETLELDLDGLKVAMIHISGDKVGGLPVCAAGSPTPTSSSSATRTSRGTPSTPASGSSTPDRRRTSAASPAARWGDW